MSISEDAYNGQMQDLSQSCCPDFFFAVFVLSSFILRCFIRLFYTGEIWQLYLLQDVIKQSTSTPGSRHPPSPLLASCSHHSKLNSSSMSPRLYLRYFVSTQVLGTNQPASNKNSPSTIKIEGKNLSSSFS